MAWHGMAWHDAKVYINLLIGDVMLHAIEKNKSKLYERYRGVRAFHDRGNLTMEDEITSIIFGPLEFMSVTDVWDIAKILLGKACNIDNHSPTKFELKFWEKLKKDDGNHIEPDAELIFLDGEKRLLGILIELKWNAPEGENQLEKQWAAFNEKMGNCPVHHLFIAKKIAANKVTEKVNSANLHDKLVAVSWDDVKSSLYALHSSKSFAVSRWADLSSNFIQCALSGRPFTGFGTEDGFGQYPEIDFSSLEQRPLFWDDHLFARINNLVPAEIPLHQPLFFKENEHE
jgi:hypothetical protein